MEYSAVLQFPVRPHWTKNTRSVFEQSVKNLDPDVRSYVLYNNHF